MVAGIVATRHIAVAIWIIALSLLIYVLVFWISSRGQVPLRTSIAIVMAVIVLGACAYWDFAEISSRNSATGESSPGTTVNIQQNVPGAGSTAVIGNGNSVNTNAGSPPAEDKKGEKR